MADIRMVSSCYKQVLLPAGGYNPSHDTEYGGDGDMQIIGEAYLNKNELDSLHFAGIDSNRKLPVCPIF